MEYFKLRDGNKLPVIALGPGAVVRKEVLPYAHLSSNPIVKIGQKVVNKLIYEKESLVFINNVARGHKFRISNLLTILLLMVPVS